MGKGIHFFVFAAVAIASAFDVLNVRAAEDSPTFEVEGVLRVTHPLYKFPTGETKLQVIRRGNQWCIRELMRTHLGDPASYPVNLPVPHVAVQTLSYDGTNIYYVEFTATNSLDSASFESVNAISNSVVGNIYAPGFPNRLLAPTLVMMFYGYLSTEYMNSITNDLLDPIKLGPDFLKRGDERVHAVYERGPGPLALPTHVVFSYYGSQNPTDAVFEASSFTNISGMQLPTQVTTTRYMSDGTLINAYDFHAMRISGKLTSSVSFRPDLGGRAIVQDFRFSHGKADVPCINYGVTDHWPTVAEAKLNPAFKVTQEDWEEIRRATLNYRRHPQSSPIVCPR